MPEPRISVLMPFHNVESYLGQAIGSILRQTESRFELLGLDDGSTDRSGAVFRDHARDDSRLRLVSFPRQGLVATLNAGIALARAPYIARMDADDIALPTRFALQLDFLERNPDCVVVGTAMRELLPDGPGRPILLPTCFAYGAAAVPQQIELVHPTTMMRRAALMSVGGYRAAFEHAEDADLWLRLIEIGSIANLPQVLHLYRRHDAQVSSRHAAIQSFRANVAKTFAVARSNGGEPALDPAVPITPCAVARLVPQSSTATAARLDLDLAAACLQQPFGRVDHAKAARLVLAAARLDGASLAEPRRREQLIATVSHGVRAGDRLMAAAVFALAIRAAPGYTLRRLSGWLARRLGVRA